MTGNRVVISIELDDCDGEKANVLMTVASLLRRADLVDVDGTTKETFIGGDPKNVDFWAESLPSAVDKILSAVQYLMMDSLSMPLNNPGLPLFVSLANQAEDWDNVLARMRIIVKEIENDLSQDPRRKK